MRLFYQSFGVSRGSRDGHYGQVLKRIVETAAAPGTTISIEGLSPHRAVADQYRYLELLDTVEVTENGLRAEREGYDAFLVGNIFEPGLHELRELLNIPVLGLRESSLHVACMMGASFSLININPKFVPRIMEGVRLQGLQSRLVSIERMTVERPGSFDIAFRDADAKAEIVRQFQDAARQAIAKGAEVLIPAGGSLMALLIEAGIHEIDATPVLNGIIALVKTAEMAAQMRGLTGHFTSKRMTYAPPSGKLLADVRQAYGEAIYPGAT
uniref:Aspartate/glutamate racemase family protein n=1 Tax=Bosea sp. NBC_00436 TaxID=2969620 RepID=A0A9E8CKS5_9HYPH